MIRWLRVVLPPGWVFVLAAFFYLVMQIYARVLEWVEGIAFFGNPDRMTALYLTFLAMLYAIYRVASFHPATRPGYFEWLRGTPWTSRQPLPLGPVHLVWQDAVILGTGLAVFAPLLQWRSVFVIEGFLVAYLVALAMVSYLTGQRVWSYALVFGVGSMVLCWPDPFAFFVVAAVTCWFGWVALRESLARFPWEDAGTLEAFHRQVRVAFYAQKHLQVNALGWPHDQMGPESVEHSSRGVGIGLTTWRDTLLTGLVVGWIVYVMFTCMRRGNPAMGPDYFRVLELLLYVFSCLFLIGGRLCIYLDCYRPPLSLMGRLAHLRLIIPGFDQVLVAPLLAIMVLVAASNIVMWTKIDSIITLSIAAALTWWILLGVGPSLKTWRLTGHHRIVRSIFQKDMVQTS
jgi:hypothetical protein